MSVQNPKITLTVHELRALARLEGLVLPAFATDADEDDPVIDLVALRGLVARGLVVLADDAGSGVDLAPDLAEVVTPARDALAVVEVDDERSGAALLGWGVVGTDDGPCCTFVEQPGAVVEVSRSDTSLLAAVAAHVGVDAVAPTPAPDGFVVALGLQVAADAAVLDGARDEALALLVEGGAPVPTATRWVEAVATRRRAVGVQVARRDEPDGPVRAAEVHWLVAGDGTAWMLTPRAEPIDDPEAAGLDLDDQDRASLVTVLVAPVGRDDLRRALAALAPTPTTPTPSTPGSR
ncbi:MAG TPA: hypothetical protein VK507_01235 [Iamia sp.]|nr:hypothetical protein [Iamia sp.]